MRAAATTKEPPPKKGARSPLDGIDTHTKAKNLVTMPKYEHWIVRQLMLEREGMRQVWEYPTLNITADQLVGYVLASLPEQPENGTHHWHHNDVWAVAMDWQGGAVFPSIRPQVFFPKDSTDRAAYGGRLIDPLDLVMIAAEEFSVNIKGFGVPVRYGGINVKLAAMVRKALAKVKQDAVPPVPVAVPRWKPYREHPGTTVPMNYQDPSFKGISDWSHYPVLQDRKQYRVVKLSFGSKVFAEARFGLQDGIPVMGYNWMDGKGGGGCAPGRKWGEFDTLKAAEIYAWEYMRGKLAERVKSGDHGNTERNNIGHVVELIDHRLTTLVHQAASMATAPPKDAAPKGGMTPKQWTEAHNATQGQPAQRYELGVHRLPYIGEVIYQGPWILAMEDGSEYLVNRALAPGWTCVGVVGAGPGWMAPKGQPPEAIRAQLPEVVKQRGALKGRALANFQIGLMNDTFKASLKKPKKKLGHQAGDVLPDGTMVVDPTNAILELHDQANAVVATPPATAPTREPAAPLATRPAARNLAELAAPFGTDRRERETIKRRFFTLYGKLLRLPKDQLAAFLQYIQEHSQ